MFAAFHNQSPLITMPTRIAYRGDNAIFRVSLGAKASEVFLCFLAIIFLGSIVLTSQRLLCIRCFTSHVSFTGFYTEDEPIFRCLQNFYCNRKYS